MKKIIFFILILMFFVFAPAWADFMPGYTNSIKHYGIGGAKITNFAKIYESPDESSKILQKIYWDNTGAFITENKEAGSDPKEIFMAFLPNENIALLSVEDENEEWLKVCYNQKRELFGWLKKEDDKNGAKFYSYLELFSEHGKKHGIYTFRNLPANYKTLHGAPDIKSRKIDDFDYPKFISPWLVRGNWMLVKVVTYDNKTKTGWFRWRSDEGRLYAFFNLK